MKNLIGSLLFAMLALDKGRVDIEKMRIDMDKFRREMRWEPWKALAAIVIGIAVMGMAVFGLTHWIAPR